MTGPFLGVSGSTRLLPIMRPPGGGRCKNFFKTDLWYLSPSYLLYVFLANEILNLFEAKELHLFAEFRATLYYVYQFPGLFAELRAKFSGLFDRLKKIFLQIVRIICILLFLQNKKHNFVFVNLPTIPRKLNWIPKPNSFAIAKPIGCWFSEPTEREPMFSVQTWMFKTEKKVLFRILVDIS